MQAPSGRDNASHYPNSTEGRTKQWTQNQMQNLTWSRNRAWLAGVPKELPGARQGCGLHLTRQELWGLQNRTHKNTQFLVVKEKNYQQPTCSRAGQLPSFSQTGCCVALHSCCCHWLPAPARGHTEPDSSGQVVSCSVQEKWSLGKGKGQQCSPALLSPATPHLHHPCRERWLHKEGQPPKQL